MKENKCKRLERVHVFITETNKDICSTPTTSPGFKFHLRFLWGLEGEHLLWFLFWRVFSYRLFYFCCNSYGSSNLSSWTSFCLDVSGFSHIVETGLFFPSSASSSVSVPCSHVPTVLPSLCLTGTRRQSVTVLHDLASQTQKIPSKAETWQVFFTFHCSSIHFLDCRNILYFNLSVLCYSSQDVKA